MTNRFGRRTFIGSSAAAAAAAVFAKGGHLSATTPGTAGAATPITGAPTPHIGGNLKILNWQLYIDVTDGDYKGTVDRFQEQTGIATQYLEDFNDNEEVFNRELMPIVGAGKQSTYDIICPTYWMAARIKGLDWLEPLPLDQIPNHANLVDSYKQLPWDEGAHYFMPWQAGVTGLAYRKDLTGRPLTSVNDLFDPAFKGKVAMLTEMRDTIGLVMLAEGGDPSKVDKDAMNKVLDKIDEAAKSGQIRMFTGNEYVQSLETGDLVACLSWSGDIVIFNSTRPESQIEFVFPDEGAMQWFDAMVIPKGAANIAQAAAWMNFVYDPDNAALITEYTNFIPPVKGVKERLLKKGGAAAKLAESQIMFPSEETQQRLHVFADLDEETEAELADRFLKISGG